MMFSRVLLVALCIVYATSLTPLTAPADDDCALYLTGPGRSSAYDYSLNLLKGNFAYDGQHTCITYEAINQAYLDARSRILVAQPKGDWKAEDFASVGELILDVSISLARTYGLSYEEVEKGLPLIDTSRTLIREVCPPVFSHVECRAGKYRRLDGLCNNLRHPTWGATMAPFQRLIGPLFADGINAPRISHTGRDLPLSRVVSRTMHPDDGFHDHAGTVMVIAWGQFMDHDYTLTGTPLDPVHRNDPEECCKRPPHLKHPYCNEIRVPDDDYFYRLFGVKCIDFVRGFPSPRPGCRLGSRSPFNTLTGAIDGNTVYGVTEKFARKLRTGYGGLLRMNPVFKEYGLKDLLPLKLDIPDEGCTRPNKNMYCFEAGEIRVNEQLVLTVMHTLMAREHNRVAEALAVVNPHWDDETLFQEARRINIAEIQHITYNEFLPILLGKDVMEKFGLVLEKEGYWDGYDPEVNPDVIASFAAAAYRFGHSLLPTAVERWSKAHKFIASKRLSDLIRRPYDLYRAGVLDEYVMGLMNQVAQAMDDSITQEVTNHLFKKVGARFGMDLVSFNMQRGREFGLPGYMEFRKFCGLSGADSFQDLFGSMPNETIHKYESIFEHPIDVDLWSGGVSERPLPGSMLGPTFACIIATQFSYSRRGDRFWFELPNQPSSFTHEQMAEIRKSRLARVICDNTDIIDTVQLYPMVLPDHELNPRVPCRSGIIPSMDFSKWAEPAPFVGGAKEYMTDAYICNKTNDSDRTQKEIFVNVTNVNLSTVPNSLYVDNNNNSNLSVSSPKKDNQRSTSNVISQNGTGNTLHETPKNVDCKNETNHKDDNITKQNKIHADIVLQYVYKKSENVKEKTKGHVKNSLKRKKRNVHSENIHQTPLLFDSNIKHDKEAREGLQLPQLTPDGIIKSANLADFNIETLHKNLKPASTLENNRKYSEDITQHLPLITSTETDRHTDREDSNSTSEEDEQMNEKIIPYRNTNYNDFIENGKDKIVKAEHVQESEENIFYPDAKNKEHFDKYKDLPESSEKKVDPRQQYKESEESIEQYLPNIPLEKDKNEVEKTKHDKVNERNAFDSNTVNKKLYDNYRDLSQNTEEESIESEEIDEQYSPRQTIVARDRNEDLDSDNEYNSRESKFVEKNKKLDGKELLQIGTKSSEDSVEDNIENINQYPVNNDYPIVPSTKENVSTQKVDVDNLSNENTEINDQVETDKDFDKNNHNIIPNMGNIEPLIQITIKPKEHYILTDENNGIQLNDNSNEYEKQVKINDDEVKPVIELNNEDSDEESDENTNDTLNANLKENVEESFNSNNSQEIEPPTDDRINVKQQFERIPLNYNHALQKTNTSENKQDDSDGTLDTISPKKDNFDENLNIKFSDITVNLPEITLPDDILSYVEEPHYKNNKDKEKNTYFYYDNNDKQAEEESEKPDDDDENENKNHDDYYKSYFYKPNEELKNLSPENTYDEQHDKNNEEDPYEKFVRERFGKTFKQRLQMLQEKTPEQNNPKLFEKIQNVLKKANDIQKEADKSGDPNAGYLWTLEYGENL